MKTLYLGCTKYRHAQISIHAVINARGGQLWRNDTTIEDTELMRDAMKIRTPRVRFYQFNSRFFRRNISRVEHLLSSLND